jgi:hypothetical protein
MGKEKGEQQRMAGGLKESENWWDSRLGTNFLCRALSGSYFTFL